MTPIKAIRRKCLECMGGSYKAVKLCPRNGIDGPLCSLWPFRFGIRPETACKRLGAAYMASTPSAAELSKNPVASSGVLSASGKSGGKA